MRYDDEEDEIDGEWAQTPLHKRERTPLKGEEDAYGFLLRRKRAEVAEPHDSPLGTHVTREDRIRALVRCELLASGSFQAAKFNLLPARICEAVDENPQVPPSGLRVRRLGECAKGYKVPLPPAIKEELRAELMEAKRFRDHKGPGLTADEEIVRDEMTKCMAQQWTHAFVGRRLTSTR